MRLYCDSLRRDIAGAVLGAAALLTPVTATAQPPLTIPPFQQQSGCFDGESVVNAQTLVAFGGAPLSGYTWALSNLSAFPAGTTVEPLTGIFRGTGGAVAPGTHAFNMTVSDGSRQTSGDFTFVVEQGDPVFGCGAAIFQQSVLANINLPDATPGAGYGAGLFVTLGAGVLGATTPLSWSLAGGSLPPGLVIDQAKGVVRGTVFSSGANQTYRFKIAVRDNNDRLAILSEWRGVSLVHHRRRRRWGAAGRGR